MLRRRTAYLLVTLSLTAIALLTTAPAALAHATLLSTSPADGAVVASAPASVSATFDESVGVSADSLRVFAPNGQRADTGTTTRGRAPGQITVGLVPGLGRGTYTVGWHVVSADSHPVQGAFTFSIGAPSASSVTKASLEPPAGKLVSFAFGMVRGIAFGAFALMIGAVAFVLCCWPAGARRPGIIRLALTGWGGLTAATLAAILLQGVYGAGQGLGHVFWPDVLHATLDSRYGRALGVRLLLAIIALVAFAVTLSALPTAGRRARGAALVSWGIVAAALAATWAVADHAGTGMQVPLSIPSDIIHLSAIAVWIGGLATLITVVLRPADARATRRAERRRYQAATADAAQAVSRFSPIALGCVAAIVASGTYQAWRGVGSFGALVETTYGRLVLAKIGAMCCLIVLGNLARHRVRRLQQPMIAIRTLQATVVRQKNVRVPQEAAVGAAPGSGVGARASNGAGGPDDDAQRHAEGATVTMTRLRWSVTAEALIAAAVLTVTAILVNTPTARESYHPPVTTTAAFDTGGPGGRGTVSVVATPDLLGPNQLRISLASPGGQPYRPAQVSATLSLPGRDLGPLPVPLTAGQPGSYVSAPVIATFTGQWQLRITIRSDDFDETTIPIPISIR